MPREPFEHEYPPGEWTVDGITQSLRERPVEFPLPTYGDTNAWGRMKSCDLTAPVVEAIRDQAATETGTAVPPLPASRYLDYVRTGNRSRYQDVYSKRTTRLSAFALAECFEREGAYLDDILDYAWALCEQTTWLLPAHLPHNQRQTLDGLPTIISDDDHYVTLRSAAVAKELAEIVHVLDEQLHPALSERIRHEVDRRVLTPYEVREDFFWLQPPANNWNAVCNTGVGLAALHLLDDPDRQARILAKVVESLEHYLADFDPGGCTAEGISYWNYGFKHYVTLAAHLDTRTGGDYSLLSPPIVHRIAQYPSKVQLSPGHFVPFSDAQEEERVDPFTACWLGRQLDLPGLATIGHREFERQGEPTDFGGTLRALQEIQRGSGGRERPTLSRRIYFDGYEWWISRVDPADLDGLVVAAKGGNNAEPHNHNDLGSVVVHSRGESLFTDLGSPIYDAGFFSARRYDYLAARSLGHGVPYVNGVEQAAGEGYTSTVLDRTEDAGADSFSLQLANAYPDEARLTSLVRTITLNRPAERLVIGDEVEFEAADNEFVEVLVSYLPMEANNDDIDVTGQHTSATVSAASSPDRVGVEHIEDAIRGNDVWRARLAFDAGDRLDVSLDVRFD